MKLILNPNIEPTLNPLLNPNNKPNIQHNIQPNSDLKIFWTQNSFGSKVFGPKIVLVQIFFGSNIATFYNLLGTFYYFHDFCFFPFESCFMLLASCLLLTTCYLPFATYYLLHATGYLLVYSCFLILASCYLILASLLVDYVNTDQLEHLCQLDKELSLTIIRYKLGLSCTKLSTAYASYQLARSCSLSQLWLWGELQPRILTTNWHGGEKLAKASYPIALSELPISWGCLISQLWVELKAWLSKSTLPG